MLEDPAIDKVGQNLKYDRIVLRNAGIELAGMPFDTMVASYLLDAGQRNHNLDDLAKRVSRPRHHQDRRADRIGQAPEADGRGPRAANHRLCRRRCPGAGPLAADSRRRMEEESLVRLFRDVDMLLIDVLVELEYNGVKIDVDAWPS